jgi:pimeloyl-ACP methyl ester carboxylesterase
MPARREPRGMACESMMKQAFSRKHRDGWRRLGRGMGVLLCGAFGAALAAAAAGTSPPAAAVAEETVHIPGSLAGMRLGMRHAVARGSSAQPKPLLLVLQGAGVPVSGNADYPFGGRSMLGALAESGFDVWAMDYYGFGESDRYPEMAQAAGSHPPLGRVDESADQVQAAVAYLLGREHTGKLMLLGDSGGSIVAGLFATRHPELISRLVLFGPMTPFTPGPPADAVLPAYILMTPKELWDQFDSWAQAAGAPDVLDSSEYPAWAATYLRSDPASGTRKPPSVKIPNGRQADAVAIETGRFPYDPSRIRASTLIVMGEWDAIATFPGAQWLLQALVNAPERRLVVIGRGSHTIQYERERGQLYRVVAEFLGEPAD